MTKLMVSSRWAWGMFFIAAIFYGFEYLLRVSPSVMVPYLMESYSINAKQVGVLSAYYYYTYTPLQVIAGTMVDHYGSRILLTISIIACVIGIYLFGLTESLFLAKAGRALIGFGSAFAFVCTLRICSDWLPGRMFSTLAGITTTIGMIGAISGEVFLESLKDTIGVPYTFMVYILFGLILTAATWLIIRDKNNFEIKSSGISELRSLCEHVLFLMKKPLFWHISLIGLFLFMPTTIFASLWAVKFLSDIYHIKAAAHLSSMIFVGWAVGGPLVGLIKHYRVLSSKTILILGTTLAAIVSYLLVYQISISSAHLALLLFLFGLFSSAEILIFDINHIISGPALCGTAVALTNMVVMLGGFAQPLVGILLDQSHNLTETTYSYAEYKIALSILPISFFIGLILTLFFNEKSVKAPENVPE